MKTKYIKVPTAERLPEDEGYYYTSHGGFEWSNKNQYFYDDNGENIDYVNYWLEEIPDREDEMREMLEEYVQAIENETIIVKENEDNDGWENFGGKFYDKVKQLLNKQ